MRSGCPRKKYYENGREKQKAYIITIFVICFELVKRDDRVIGGLLLGIGIMVYMRVTGK